MTEELPKLLKDAIKQNRPNAEIITKQLKLPWLKLDIKLPTFIDFWPKYLESIKGKDWRQQWKFENLKSNNNYQVKEWNGDLLFGPHPHDKFLETTSNIKYNVDEDSRCKYYRNDFEFKWYVDENNKIRKWISWYLPDNDINIVNTYYIPPGGYVFPHRDYSFDDTGLAKIYVAAIWGEGNVFGMYGCGDVPIKQGDVFLVNNYTLPHWVYNGSNDNRVVIDIGANLNSPIIKKLIESSFTKRFSK